MLCKMYVEISADSWQTFGIVKLSRDRCFARYVDALENLLLSWIDVIAKNSLCRIKKRKNRIAIGNFNGHY